MLNFRTRLLMAFVVAAALPLLLLAFGVRREVQSRMQRQYVKRVDAQIEVAREDLRRESERIATALATLGAALAEDDRFRLGAVRGMDEMRTYVRDYAVRAMRLSGLEMLQLEDSAGRILSSGHFHNEFDRVDAGLSRQILATGSAGAITSARSPYGSFYALARSDSVRIGGRLFFVTGGRRVDEAFLRRFAREDGSAVSLVLPDSSVVTAAVPVHAITAALALSMVTPDSQQRFSLVPVQLVISHATSELAALQRDLNMWFMLALILVAVAVIVLAAWMSARLSRPLADLAQATSRMNLEGADVKFATGREDEIGVLARRLEALGTRLRSSAAQLRDAERRVTVGDMARQVNHDIKNGLIPIRNVLRHLAQIRTDRPAELAEVFADRQSTLDSSVEYLDTLARNYARLTPRIQVGAIDVNTVVREAAKMASAAAELEVNVRTVGTGLHISGDAVVLRRILDNLLRNAIESVNPAVGSVTLSVRREGNVVIITVADTGRGMNEQERAQAFDDFFTTKSGGTGLGLSVVRRLTSDLGGSVRVESQPGRGTTFTLEFPAMAQQVLEAGN